MIFDAFGRLALGQIQQDYTKATAVLVGAAGGGVAGGIGSQVSPGTIVGVAGGGVAGSMDKSVGVLVIGVSGNGEAGEIVRLAIPGGFGQGIAGNIGFKFTIPIIGAAGIGRAGQIIGAISRGFLGVAGIGRAGNVSLKPAGGPSGVAGQGIAGDIVIKVSGGGGNGPVKHEAPPRRRAKNERTGFEPIKKLPPAKIKPRHEPEIYPPVRTARVVTKAIPPDIIDRGMLPADLLAMQHQIYLAEDMHDIEQFLRGVEQDEQDAADIADIMALLEMID